MLTKKQIYDLLKCQAKTKNKMGNEIVSITISKDMFNSNYHYKKELFYDTCGKAVTVNIEARYL